MLSPAEQYDRAREAAQEQRDLIAAKNTEIARLEEQADELSAENDLLRQPLIDLVSEIKGALDKGSTPKTPEMRMNASRILEMAIQDREKDYQRALNKIEPTVEASPDLLDQLFALREAIFLVRCMRELIQYCELKEIHAAFGAPGDFGYHTKIGDALARTYGVVK